MMRLSPPEMVGLEDIGLLERKSIEWWHVWKYTWGWIGVMLIKCENVTTKLNDANG